MNRREFVKKSAISASLPFWLQGCGDLWNHSFPIHLHSDHQAGHQIMKSLQWKQGAPVKTEVVIVGGGIAGLASAATLAKDDFLLFELSGRLGGTSAAEHHKDIVFSQGAHYELAYPDYFGEEVIRFLEKLQVISYEPWKKMWSFNDKQHIIPPSRRERCFDGGNFRKDVLEDGLQKKRVYEILSHFEGKMPLPTRLISQEYRYLNDLTFYDFLSREVDIDKNLERQLSYHMLDDYGGTIRQVSALSGIHYFTCRPYRNQPVDLFSPNMGNHYFSQKIAEQLRPEKLRINHLVKKVEKNGSGYQVEVLDILNQKVIPVTCDKVIYAGQKHALKYIYPEESKLFSHEYAPWMVVNLITQEDPSSFGFWQNEYIGDDKSFLGFIDSSVQSKENRKGKRVYSAYYCLKPEDRNYLITIESHKKKIVSQTKTRVEEMLTRKIQMDAAYIHVMGHAMPVPEVGYLFQDANTQSRNGLVYAGVDNGRLPLLYEAIDSGLVAGKMING